MRKLVTVVLLVSLGVRSAEAQSWVLGSHLGLASVNSSNQDDGSSTVVSWPSNILAYQPSLRIGVASPTHAHEVFLDTGLLFIDEAGSTLSELATDLSYQYAFRASAPLNPYANWGLGFYREGSAGAVSTTLAYGAGVGIRRAVSQRHGCLRVEARLDRLDADKKLGRPHLTLYGLRAGFDLWL